MNGFFKIKMKRFDRWFYCAQLPSEPIYREWLYFDGKGVPIIYWHVERQGVMLLG